MAEETFAEKLQRVRAEAVAAGKIKPKPVEYVFDPEDLLPDLGSDDGLSDAAQAINTACDSIDILEVYRRLSKNRFEAGHPGKRTEGILVSCPNPAHPDEHPSAWISTVKQVYHCGACAEGDSKYKIAAYAYGLDTRADFWEIKKRMARDLRGVDYDALAAPMPAQVMTPAVTKEPSATSDPAEPEAGLVEEAAAPDPFEAAVAKETSRQLIYLEARDRAKKIKAQELFEPLSFVNLADEFELPVPEVTWTIEGLHAVGGNTTITAGFKTGKTTLMRNLVRSLADGVPFLGEHEIRKLEGRIAYFNFEVIDVEFRDKIRELGIKNAGSVFPIHLRERHFDLMQDETFEDAASALKRAEVEVVILDPFSGAYYGDENSNSEQNLFLKRLDQFKRAAGVVDLFMPVHTGRTVEEGNERARGAAKLDDWADNRWIYAKHVDSGERFLGGTVRRLGDLKEQETRLDPTTQQLVYSPFKGTRKEKAGDQLKGEVLAYVAANPGCTSNAITGGVVGNAQKVRDVIRRAIRDLDVETRDGANRSTLHYLMGQAPPPQGP